VALPGSPDRVVVVREAGEVEVAQVNIGSCTNSSYRDLAVVAEILRGKRISPSVSLNINPGSRQVLKMLADEGRLTSLIEAGARIFEPSCDGCIGMGSAPATGINSLRTYNRNFPGRSGTKDDRVFLASPETAVASALTGKLTDPRTLGEYPKISEPEKFWIDDSMIIPPGKEGEKIELRKGPNIKSLPDFDSLPEQAELEVLIKLGDNISTDDILPGGSKILPLRSNLPEISKYVFSRIDPDFVSRAKGKMGVIVAGENYGQGSSREHAALAPRYLGVRLVLARSFARIHRANLINFGIIPGLIDESFYKKLLPGKKLRLLNLKKEVQGTQSLSLLDERGEKFTARLVLSERERKILAEGGLLNLVRFRS